MLQRLREEQATYSAKTDGTPVAVLRTRPSKLTPEPSISTDDGLSARNRLKDTRNTGPTTQKRRGGGAGDADARQHGLEAGLQAVAAERRQGGRALEEDHSG